MCECGCEPTRMGWLKGPSRTRYVLELHPGCTGCGTEWGLGVTVVAEGSEDWEDWYSDVPELELSSRAYAPKQWGVTILDTDVLRKIFREHPEVGPDEELHDAFDEFIRRGGLIDAFRATQREQLAEEPAREGEEE